MKTKLLFFYLLLFTPISSIAQNLVPNPSFEDTVSCPDNLDQVNRASFWFAGDGTPDYFNSCFTVPAGIWNVDVPTNSFGFQSAQQGQAYVGLATFYTGGGLTIRECVGSILVSSLQTNQIYYVSMFASLRNANLGTVASNKIGVWFSNQLFSSTNPVPRNNQPQIFTNSIITDTLNWVKISGSFNPDSNYSYMYIGNFFADSLVSYTLFQGATGTSYYYIDDICVSTDSNYCATWSGVKEITKQNTITISPNPTNSVLKIDGAKNGAQIKIYNTQGNIILTTTYTKNVLDVKSLTKGMYLLQIIDGDKSSTVKFVKE